MGLEQEMRFVKPPVVVALRTTMRILLETRRGFGAKHCYLMHLFTRESAGCWLISIRMRQERNQEIC